MSHCTLVVSTGDLRSLAGRLDRVGERTEDVRRRLRHLDRSDVGSRALERALDDFQDHWDWGIDRLSRRLDVATGQLRAAADGFEQVEDELKRALCG